MASESYIATGAYGPLQPNDTAQKKADAVRAELEQATGETFEMYTAILYKTQVMEGTNYLIAVQTGLNASCHIVVHQNLDGSTRLGPYQMNMELYAPLDPIGNVPAPTL